MRRARAGMAALAAALYTAAALVYLRPFWRVFADHLAPDDADPLFTVYVLRWVGRQVRLGFPDLWNANVFYPAQGALAFSEHYLGPALVLSRVHNTVAGYNILLFLSFVATGLAVSWMLARSGVSAPAAILGGALYAFSPYRWSQLNHLALLFAPWVPLTLWSFDRLLAEPRPRRAALFLLFYGIGLLGGCYLACLIHFPLLALLLSRLATDRREILRPAPLRVLVPVALLAGAGMLAVFYPYLRISRQMPLVRGEDEVAAYAAALPSYLSPAAANLYSPYSTEELIETARVPRWQQPFVRSENSLFPGFAATLLSAAGCAAFWRRYRLRGRPIVGWRRLSLGVLLGIALAAFALGDVFTLGLDRGTFLSPWLPWATRAVWIGLGAAFAGSLALWALLRRRWSGAGLQDRRGWRAMDPWERGLAAVGASSFLLSFPLLYIPVMLAVPGMRGMRVPARFAVFSGLAVVYFAARGLDGLLSRLNRPSARRLALAGLSLLVFLELLPRPLTWVPVEREEEFPEVYRWLAGRDDVRALIEVPLRPADASEAAYMYYSTLHWKPIANGFSGFIPPTYLRITERVQGFLPDAQALDLLSQEGITHLVVHADRLGGPWRRVRDPEGAVRRWEGEVGERVALVHDAYPDRVYSIAPRAAR